MICSINSTSTTAPFNLSTPSAPYPTRPVPLWPPRITTSTDVKPDLRFFTCKACNLAPLGTISKVGSRGPNKEKRMKFRLILLSCTLALAAFAADVTGKWTYEMQGRNGAMTATLNLKADGGTLTGTVSGRGGDTEISDGKIEGDTLSFSVVREFNGNKMVMKYNGTV